ncbi:MAG: hypothetical protein RLO80_06595 [Hyphomonas sp.]
MDGMSVGLAVALVASLLVNALFVVPMVMNQTGTFLVSGEDEAFLLRDDKTRKITLLEPKMKVKPGDRRIVRFENRHRLSFPAFGQHPPERELTDDQGRISLRINTSTLAPFPVITNDGHTVYVTASVSFAVVRERAHLLARLADFGPQLERRIQSAFSSAIAELRDEEMRQRLGKIEDEVAKQLEAMENGQTGVPLGIKVYDARFQYEDGDSYAARYNLIADQPAPASAGSMGEEPAADGDSPATPGAKLVSLKTGPAGRAAYGRPGAMQFAGTELDKLLDQFKGRNPEQIAALMKLMELQTRQNIVAMLAESRGVIVFSAKELGLDGNPVVEEAVANALSPAQGPVKAAE